MDTLNTYIPEDMSSLLVMAVIALVAVWLAMFVVRKLIGFALMAAIVIGGIMVWQDPALLRTVPDAAAGYYLQWRAGTASDSDRSGW